MSRIFLSLYDFFQRRKFWLFLFFVLSVVVLSVFAFRIRIEEDISKLFPNDARVEKFNYVFQNSKLTDRLVVMVSMKDTTLIEPDSLVEYADNLISQLNERWSSYITKISGRVDSENIMQVFSAVTDYLPVFLDEDDYEVLDSLSRPEVAAVVLEDNYRQLLSPAGIFTKQIITKDPLGFSFLVLKKLQELQIDENYTLYDDYIITKDQKCLLFFIQTKYQGNDTGNNAPFINGLKELIKQPNDQFSRLQAMAFGSAMVAIDNSEQLRRDSILTMGIMLVLLTIFIYGYFRKKRTPFLIIIPVAFGGLFALAMLYLIKSSVSILAIACGSVILGIAINYSLHFLSHLKHSSSVRECIRDLANPMTLGSATTVLAFLSLQFTNASILKDIGLFAGFSLIGAALCALVFLPHFVSASLFSSERNRLTWIDKLGFRGMESNKFLLILIVVVTPVMLYFSGDVSFSKDLKRLNFMQHETRLAESRLENLNKSSLSAIYTMAEGKDIQAALRENERATQVIHELKKKGDVVKFSGLSAFYISDSLQKVRIEKWNRFWNNERKAILRATVQKEGERLKFSSTVLNNFDSLLTKEFSLVDARTMSLIRESLYDQFIIDMPGRVSLITLLNTQGDKRTEVYQKLNESSIISFDRQMVTNLFMEYINADFSFIILVTAIIVFVALILVYGRIELTLMTFIPMFLTWIWILGIMALLHIEFNFINVMVSTFIFGLGDDYSIFTMDGLLQEYRYRKKSIESTRISIILSVLTTISGLGVLIFAKHPAMRSIAAISIIGICCVFIMSQVLVPFIFRWMVTSRTKKGQPPMTLLGIIRTTYTYSIFVLGAIVLTLIGFIIRIIPIRRKRTKLFYHHLIRLATGATIYSDPFVKKKINGLNKNTFEKPSVIISNHSSFLDILLTAMLHPKVILMTNRWVWKSPVFGGVVQLAQYYPASDGAEESIPRLRKVVENGYSIVVFPEGTRSKTGKIGRFHKGSFYLAQELNIPITPLLIHGAGRAIPKGSFYLNSVPLAVKGLPSIAPDDLSFGKTYQERTKSISAYFKHQHKKFSKEQETGRYFNYTLQTNYLYKGPILEWYLKVKIRLEDFYESFDALVPESATILDLGCGYGFLSYMLHFRSEKRVITAVDYDESKIETAQNCYSKNEKINFVHADVMSFQMDKYDAIVISDVLHYLKRDEQDELLRRCFGALNENGKLIVRDGDAMLAKRHRGTRLTELFSIKLLGFNKSVNELNFLSSTHLEELAEQNRMKIEKLDSTKLTSNVVFIFTAKTN